MAPPDCNTYPKAWPSPSAATTAPPAFWPWADDSPASNITDLPRACVTFPAQLALMCCGNRGNNTQPGMGLLPGAFHTTRECGWDVCVSNMTDAQWHDCLQLFTGSYEAPTNTSSPKLIPGTNYSFNCISYAESEAQAAASSAAQRAVVGAAVFGIACAALAVAV